MLGITVAVIPVVWVGIAAMSSGGGRALYLAGVCWALLLGTGLDHTAARPKYSGLPFASLALAIVLAHYATSVDAQRRVWAQAVDLARDSIAQFQPYVGQVGRLHVTNLPFWVLEGPYVLKSYAFRYYYHPHPVPEVTATALTLTYVDGEVRAVSRGPEPASAPPPKTEPDLGELDLRIPVR